MAGPYAQDIKAMAGNYLARFLGQLTLTATLLTASQESYIIAERGNRRKYSKKLPLHWQYWLLACFRLSSGVFRSRRLLFQQLPLLLVRRLQVCRLFKVIYVEI